MKKSIFHIGPLPPPVGGVAVNLKNLVESNTLQDYEHYIFDLSNKDSHEKVGKKTLSVSKVLHKTKLLFLLFNSLRKARPQLIHYQFGAAGLLDTLSDFLMIWMSIFFSKNVVLHLHIDPRKTIIPNLSHMGKKIYTHLTSSIHVIFVLNEDYKKYLLSFMPQKRIEVVPNLIEESIANGPFLTKTKTDRVRILFVGRLTKEKGIFDLIRVANIVSQTTTQFVITVAGGSAYESEYRDVVELIDSLNVGKFVHLIGQIQGDKKTDVFSKSDIVFIPSHYESFGIVALEGMATGLPVVSTQTSGAIRVIDDGVSGYLIPIGNIDKMAEVLVMLINNQDVRMKMGKAAQESFQANFSNLKTSKKILDVYDTLVERET